MSLPPIIPPAYAAALYDNAGPNYYNTPYRQGLRVAYQLIICVAKAQLVEAETFWFSTVGDGATIFEFDGVAGPPDGVVGTNVVVDVSGATTQEEVAAVVQSAVDGEGLGVVTELQANLVFLRHTLPGEVAPGNDSVTDPAFQVYEYNLGSDGDGFVPVRWGLSRAFVADGQVFS